MLRSVPHQCGGPACVGVEAVRFIHRCVLQCVGLFRGNVYLDCLVFRLSLAVRVSKQHADMVLASTVARVYAVAVDMNRFSFMATECACDLPLRLAPRLQMCVLCSNQQVRTSSRAHWALLCNHVAMTPYRAKQ
jgi:hypothetical protein